MDFNKSTMYSSLPRPGSRLPAPASSLPKLGELSQSTMNIRKNIDETPLVKSALVSKKRSAVPAEHTDQKHSQIVRSAVNQTANTQQPKSIKPVTNVRAAAVRPANRAPVGSVKLGKSSASVNTRPPTAMEVEPREDSEDSDRPKTAMSQSIQRAKIPKWDTKGRLDALESDHRTMMERYQALEKKDVESDIRVVELETNRAGLETRVRDLSNDLEHSQSECNKYKRLYEDEERERRRERDDAERQLRNETDDLRRRARDDIDDAQRRYKQEFADLQLRASQESERAQKILEDTRRDMLDERERGANEVANIKAEAARQLTTVQSNAIQELSELRARSEVEKQRLEVELDSRARTLKSLQEDLESMKRLNQDLKDKIFAESTNSLTLESSARALREKILNLESIVSSRDGTVLSREEKITELNTRLEEATIRLRTEETLRRKLHNEVLELKGNIRVFCRVRPTLGTEIEPATIEFPDQDAEGKDITLFGASEKNLRGDDVTKKHAFTYDRVFGPKCNNDDIFGDISQLVQSALDGYNVCIFCYGQTGAGKTYTMTSKDGMIPQAVNQIYTSAKELEEKGWAYTMEGSFVEVYNENINDLLGKATDLDRKKLEVRHDKGKTIITDCTSMILDGPEKMEEILNKASANRSVAATKANERSSRSHSVFILKLLGLNNITGEKSEGTLNLVDLAGSERLSHSQSTGDRLKETQNINKSLSALGDVISALASGKDGAHIPYRNSKLTYLLQNSLGGNSKTLMFVMVSPLQAHVNETITSLKFATKVINTHIGTAKKIKLEKE